MSDLRIGVIADIHGNLRALEAVRADLRLHSPDFVVNLGDHLSGPLQAAATADILMQSGYIHIRGNHDRQLLDRPIDQMGPSDRAASAQLQDRHKLWLQGLPEELNLAEGILLCHGSLRSDREYLLERASENGVYLASPEEICERLGDIGGDHVKLVLCGHSHIPRLVSVCGDIQIVNPGSVGLQAYDDFRPFKHFMETGSPHARYAILDRVGARWKATFVAVEYDWNAAAAEAEERNRPDWAHALITGYALR